jgi:hypothetical protein
MPTSTSPRRPAGSWKSSVVTSPAQPCDERLSPLTDGRLLYRLKQRWRAGTTHVLFEPLVLVRKLAALVPPPRFNLVRYHAVLAPAACWRRHVVPSYPFAGVSDRRPHLGCKAESARGINLRGNEGGPKEQLGGPLPRNYCWAELMRRVAVDLLECPRCSGPTRIVAPIHLPEAIREILACLGLPSRAPPIARAVPEDADEPEVF